MSKRKTYKFNGNAIVHVDRSHEELRALYQRNCDDPTRATYEGFTSSEIAAWNRRLMFGENDRAFPDAETWSRIVD